MHKMNGRQGIGNPSGAGGEKAISAARGKPSPQQKDTFQSVMRQSFCSLSTNVDLEHPTIDKCG
mgnify:CR=1 FL=1